MNPRRSAADPVMALGLGAVLAIGAVLASTTGASAASPTDGAMGAIVVATPFSRSPQIEVLTPNGRRQVLRMTDALGIPGDTGLDSFGDSTASAYLNQDAYPDLIVGARSADAVHIFWGDATGVSGTPDITITEPDTSRHTAFGAALALGQNRGDLLGAELWVGAPQTTVRGIPEAGAVHHYTIGPTGTVTARGRLTQDDGAVGGVAEANDQFGSVLAGTDTGVVVGVPDEDLAGIVNAGAVQQLTVAVDGHVTATQILNQGWRGLPGRAEAHDRFGASLSYRGRVVGIPGESIGKLQNAGAVQTFGSGPDGRLAPGRLISQNSKGVPGSAEDGDEFGYRVAYGAFDTGQGCFEHSIAAASAPGETIGRARRTGAVTVFDLADPASSRCPAASLYQGHGLPGRAETGDGTGRELTTRWDDTEAAENAADQLLIGVGGEDVGAVSNAGSVIRWHRGTSFAFTAAAPTRGQNFGTHLGTSLPRALADVLP